MCNVHDKQEIQNNQTLDDDDCETINSENDTLFKFFLEIYRIASKGKIKHITYYTFKEN